MSWGLSRQCQLGVDYLTEKDVKKGKELPPPEDRHTPDVVKALKASGDKVTSVACGSSHTLAVTSDGSVFSWGAGAFGKLGHEDDSDVRIPRMVEFKRKRISRVACGPEPSAVVSEAGEVLTWGAGSYGNLGHGDNTEVLIPKLVEALLGKPCISVACGSKHTLALTAYGAVFAWGYGGGGRLGCGDTRGLFRPKLVEYLKDSPSILISAGESHSMCITVERGQCYTWGVGDYGKLGHGDTTPQLLPRHRGLSPVAPIAVPAGPSIPPAAPTMAPCSPGEVGPMESSANRYMAAARQHKKHTLLPPHPITPSSSSSSPHLFPLSPNRTP